MGFATTLFGPNFPGQSSRYPNFNQQIQRNKEIVPPSFNAKLSLPY